MARTPHPSEFARYNSYEQYFPEQAHRDYAHVLDDIIEISSYHAGQIIKQMIALPPRGWEVRSSTIYLNIFGSFRDPVKAILDISDLFAPVMLERDIIPILQPLVSSQWEVAVENRTREFVRISKYGCLVYDLEKENGH